eukprot:154277_1
MRSVDLKERDQIANATARVENVELQPKTKTLPDPNKPTEPLKTDRVLNGEIDEATNINLEEEQQLSGYMSYILFWIVFGFSMLMILAIGSIIFYVIDIAASAFDFDLSVYTQYVILILTFINITMSCCGCYGTYRFSEIGKKNNDRLNAVTKQLQLLASGIGEDNVELEQSIKQLEIEITHFEIENNELTRSIGEFEGKKFGLKRISSGKRLKQLSNINMDKSMKKARKEEAIVYVNFREMWNLYTILETQRAICNISKISAYYYTYAYSDGDKSPGLDRTQYQELVDSAVVPVKDKKFFPRFNDDVWDINGRVGNSKNGAILFDEFERVLVMIYKRILYYDLKIELDNDHGMNLDIVRDLLVEVKKEEREKTLSTGFLGIRW